MAASGSAPTGLVTVADGSLLNFEEAASHIIIAEASDATRRSTVSLTIRVADVPEPLKPIVDIDPSPDKINYGASRGDAVGITARAIDPDRGSTVAYTLTYDPSGLFAIDREDGVVTLASDDYEPDQSYPIEVLAASNDLTFGLAQFAVRPDEPIRIAPSPTTPTVREGESQDIAFSFIRADLELKGISAGGSHSCGITADNRAVCWGSDDDGQSAPPADREFIALSAGGSHSCGITAANEALCWGSDEDERSSPPSDRLIALSAGGSHSCGITLANDAVCWGSDEDGQSSPPAGGKFIALSAGGSHSCGITLANDAVCWGVDASGSTMPPAGRKFIALSAGDSHSCGVTLDNRVVCWGSDEDERSSPPGKRKVYRPQRRRFAQLRHHL